MNREIQQSEFDKFLQSEYSLSFENLNFRGIKFPIADKEYLYFFHNCNFYGCDFSKSQIRGSFYNCSFIDSNTLNAEFNNCGFNACDFTCSWKESKIVNSYFHKCDFRNCSASKTTLKNVEFFNGNFNTFIFHDNIVAENVEGLDTVKITMGGATSEEIEKEKKKIKEVLMGKSERPKTGVISIQNNKEEWAAEQEKKKQELQDKIKQLGESYQENPEDLAELVAFRSNFYNYSSNNSILIYLQNPKAIFVGSFQHFKDLGYSVKKGQHGMKILVPVITTLFKANGKNKKLSEATKEEREAIKKGEIESWSVRRYKLGTVFDIAQTDCPVEDYPKIIGIGYADEKAQTLLQGVIDFCERELNCSVTIKEFDNVAVKGFYSPDEHRIELNAMFKDTQLLSTAIHEMSHAILHSSQEAREYPTSRVEFEADSLAIMLETRVGIELTEARKSHLAEHYKNLSNDNDFSIDKLLDAVTEKYEKILPGVQQYLSQALLNSPEYADYQNSANMEMEIEM